MWKALKTEFCPAVIRPSVARLVLGLTLLTGLVSSLPAQRVYTFEVIADTRGQFKDLGLFPSINAAGAVSFRGDSANQPGLFVRGEGAPITIANGSRFADFGVSDPKINDAGTVAFFANLPNGGSGIFTDAGAATKKIANTSDLFAPGETFARFGTPSINSSGAMVFTAASKARELAVFTATAGGALTQLPFAKGNFRSLSAESDINADGDVAVVGGMANGATQVLKSDPPAPLMSVAGTMNSGFSEIDSISPALTADGLSVFFIGRRSDSGARGIYRVTRGAAFPVATTADGFTDFGDFAVSADGASIAFTAVTPDGRSGIFSGNNPVTDKVVAAGDVMPLGGNPRTVDSVSLGEAGLSASGQIAFYATFTDNPATSDPNFAAIFRATPAGGGGTTGQGPSTDSAPYIVPSQPNVTTVSVFTVGDSVNNKPNSTTPYRMVGVPDGLGLLDNGDKTFTLYMNHEIAPTSGVPRVHHGSDTSGRGAFVSQWRIVGADHPTLPFLTVLNGRDFTQEVRIFDVVTRTYRAPLANPVPGAGEDDFNRLCSADLPSRSAFFFRGLGTTDRIYMNGEESPAENGRAFGHVLTGAFAQTTFELPRLGDAAWENVIANPFPQAKTIVMLNDDQAAVGGQVYMYVGTKLDPAANPSANPVELAGLNNGELYGVAVTGFLTEPQAGIPSGTRFTLSPFGDVTAVTGPQLEAQSNALGVTSFARPEDGQWDPNNPRHYYFATTGQQGTGGAIATRLWRLAFDDQTNPVLGGRIQMLLDGTEGIKNLDNLTIDQFGHVLLQEDLGNNADLSKIWRYNIATDRLVEVAAASPTYFKSESPDFQTNDEETSGIIDASTVLGPGWFLANAQSHSSANDPELVERGQLVAINVPGPTPSPTPLPTPTPTVTPTPNPERPRLQNISTRAQVQTGDKVLIDGFGIVGSNQKRVIVRALGPSLSNNGAPLPGRLQDPTLELRNANGGLIVANDNWRQSQEAEIQESGLAPNNNAESAIIRTLDPGFYTAVVRGKDDSTGIGLAETYDLDLTGKSKLVNISTRGFINAGDDALIGGFIAGGGDPGGQLRVVVRALGPTLRQYGLPTPLQDPTVELVNSNGMRIDFNNDWRDTQEAELKKTGLAPENDREAALVTNLPEGSYTAVVRGRVEPTGSGLVEVYNVPPAN